MCLIHTNDAYTPILFCPLSHGANDVANAMGPFAAVYTIYRENAVLKGKDIGGDMYWILFIGGAGIVVGLSTYGYKIITALGLELVTVTPSRGYCIELGAAFVVMYGSTQGWPLSTTHCQVGATVGVGLFEGASGVNGRTLGMAVLGCFATLLVGVICQYVTCITTINTIILTNYTNDAYYSITYTYTPLRCAA
jgi:phosphate/sulfate permease